MKANYSVRWLLVSLFCVLLLLTECNCGFAHKQHLIDGYYLVACDGKDYMVIGNNDYGRAGYSHVVSYTVFAAGYNENFIIAKQHPREFTKPIDKSITNYYIIPVKNNPFHNAIGPLTLEQFIEKRKELNVPDSVKFTIEFEKLK